MISVLYLTLHEAAALTGLSNRTLRNQIKRDGVKLWAPTVRGTRVRFQDLIRYLPPEMQALVPASMDWTDAEQVRGLHAKLVRS